jgi:hypothetical protein
MTEVSMVTAQTAEIYRQLDIKKLDKRHEEIVQEERRVKHDKEINEEARITVSPSPTRIW